MEEAGETPDEKALYKLIRLRALACQLADAVFAVRVARLGADVDGKQAIFEAKGRTMTEQGWQQVLAGADEEDSDTDPANPVPELKNSSQTVATDGTVTTKKTKPKSRFKEATLIREMEKRGIGRPATYAAILDNIIAQKQYLRDDKGNLVPTARGEKLVSALLPCFSFMDYEFTKNLELKLDRVAEGKLSYEQCVSATYDKLEEEMSGFKQNNIVPCPECGDREQFRHILSKEKGWNFWGCKVCGSTFVDDGGRPGAKQEKKEQKLTEFACPKCGKPLAEKPTKKGDIWFGCSGFPACKARYWAKEDNSPDFDNPPK